MTPNSGSDGLGSKWIWWRRHRYVLLLWTTIGFSFMYMLRVNLSIIVVDMTSPHNITIGNTTIQQDAEFSWDSRLQGIVLSSFYYGYLVTQLLGGWLSTHMGAAQVLGASIAGSGLVEIFMTPMVKCSPYLFIAGRVVQGLLQGVALPAMTVLWIHWSPKLERSFFVSVCLTGCASGLIVALPVTALISSRLGWESVFYIFSATSLLWSAIWFHVANDQPEEDNKISASELKYINNSVYISKIEKNTLVHPWCKFFTSIPVLAVFVAEFASSWGLYTFLTYMPTFMKDAFSFDIEKIGFLSSIPYLTAAILLPIVGKLMDWLQAKNTISVTQLRKLFVCLAFVVQSCFLFLLTYVRIPSLIIFCLTGGIALGAFHHAALGVIFMDLSPRHCGVLTGISNTISNISGIVSPLLTGLIVQHKDIGEWKIVFYLTCSMYVFAAVVFALFGSAEQQWWNVENCGETSHNNGKSKNLPTLSKIEETSQL